MKKITFTVAPDGTVTSVVNGVAGPKCTDLTKFLDALGQVTEDRKTSEFYQPVINTGLKVGGGQ